MERFLTVIPAPPVVFMHRISIVPVEASVTFPIKVNSDAAAGISKFLSVSRSSVPPALTTQLQAVLPLRVKFALNVTRYVPAGTLETDMPGTVPAV